MPEYGKNSIPLTVVARQACTRCKVQKRKCTRELPTCELCRKNRRPCEYTPEALSDISSPEIEPQWVNIVPRSQFPSMFFLDNWLFNRRNTSVSTSASVLPPELLDAVGNEPRVVERALDLYFQSAHSSFPIVARSRAYQQCAVASAHPADADADLILFMIVIRLFSTSLSQGKAAAEGLYAKAKLCYSYLETRGVISVRLLQAVVLLAYWEIGNSVFPSAFLTVGLSSRLAAALGIHRRRDVPLMFPMPGSLVQLEEQRRIWWGISILDRYITTGLVGRPLACDNAAPDDLLPMEEEFWELGEPCVIPSLAVSADATTPVSAFARTCQASHLLARVLRHDGEKPSELKGWYNEAMQLHQILASFTAGLMTELKQINEGGATPGVIRQKELSLYPAIGLGYTAQIHLYDLHTCAEYDDISGVGIPEQLQMQAISIAGIKAVCPAVSRFAVRVRAMLEEASEDIVSPLVANCMYGASKYYFWYYRESNRAELLGEVKEIIETLRMIARTWAIAEEYLSILDGDEFRPGPESILDGM